ncbi:lymphotoxin-beta isoform X1 [Phascolarctos cinereus]
MAWKLIFIFLSACPGASPLSIFQPPSIQAQEGGSVSLSCLFNISQEGPAIGFATWYLDVVAPDREVNNKTLEFRGRLEGSDQAQFLWDRLIELRIRDIRVSDAGLYLCKVEILGSGSGTGEGTKLVVKEGFHKLPVESRSDLSSIPPAAHLIGVSKSGHGLRWVSGHEEAFLKSGTQFLGDEGLLALPQDGIYFLYCHIGYRGRAPSGGEQFRSQHQAGDFGVPVTLRSWLFRTGGASGSGEPELLLQGSETVTPPMRGVGQGTLWYASVGFGGLAQLRGGERIYVNVSHLDMVDFRRGKTFFGAVMVG